MAQGKVNRKTLAAALLIQRLRQGRGKADSKALKAALGKHRLNARYLNIGVRVIRDLYGDNALVVEVRGNGQSPVYILDPKKYGQTREWAKKMFGRARTETLHVIQVLQWSMDNGLAATSAKRAKHYAENVVVELESVLSTL